MPRSIYELYAEDPRQLLLTLDGYPECPTSPNGSNPLQFSKASKQGATEVAGEMWTAFGPIETAPGEPWMFQLAFMDRDPEILKPCAATFCDFVESRLTGDKIMAAFQNDDDLDG